jgi:Pyruvate:ferredoxin oxidoreductase and related 2-oxoacid:ferredoxin oxidoreductases, gamma subunit
MAADFNWAVGGEAGDGIDSTGKIFAQALSRAGRHVFTSKDFASRIRGGYTAYKVRTSVDKVQSVVDRLDVLIALTPRTIEENLDELHEGSVIIYDGERTTMQDVEIPDETDRDRRSAQAARRGGRRSDHAQRRRARRGL